MASTRATVAAIVLASLSGACASIRENHGYIAEAGSREEPIQPGVDTKSTVLARFGSPSTRGAFDDENWYYISTSARSFAFFNPEITRREIIAVRFSDDDTVAAVETFGLERGRVVNYSDKKTPTRGRELSILEQLLGSIGNAPIPLPGAEEQNPGGGRPR